jgi:predicted ester cyclase
MPVALDEGKTRMSIDENKAIVHRYFDERWNRKNRAVIDELLGDGMDLDDAQDNFETMHAAIKDLEIIMSDFIGDGDQVVVRWTVTGIHQGELLGVAPSGQQISFQGQARNPASRWQDHQRRGLLRPARGPDGHLAGFGPNWSSLAARSSSAHERPRSIHPLVCPLSFP